MDSSIVPPIYSPTFGPMRLSIVWRLLALGVAVGCLAVLITAAKVEPSPEGIGTHHQLNMARCGFLEQTGIPCMSCGMTTSFAWFVRGNLLASFYVQPIGMVLAFFTACSVWVGLYIAWTGIPATRLLKPLAGINWVVPILAFVFLGWAWKIFIHVRGIDGWG